MAGDGDRPVVGTYGTDEASRSPVPTWVTSSTLLSDAYALAERAHGLQRRPSDERLFREHVGEVGRLLYWIKSDEKLIAVGLLHDSVERGVLSEAELRVEMGDGISDLVMILSEDPSIEPFGARKAAPRDRVASAGERAMTVFAADKLSDIAGLRRGVERSGQTVEQRIGTSVASMAEHYRDSVAMIASMAPGSAFLTALGSELRRLEELSTAW